MLYLMGGIRLGGTSVVWWRVCVVGLYDEDRVVGLCGEDCVVRNMWLYCEDSMVKFCYEYSMGVAI